MSVQVSGLLVRGAGAGDVVGRFECGLPDMPRAVAQADQGRSGRGKDGERILEAGDGWFPFVQDGADGAERGRWREKKGGGV